LTLTALAPNKKQIGRFCGEKGTIQQEIKSDANDVIIVFNSDLAGSFTGFRLQYTTEQLDSLCIGVTKLTGKRGQVSSIPITPDYNRMLTCSWLIEGSPGKQIEIQVTNIFTSKDCLQDFVSFIDGPSVADREIARICGDQKIEKTFRSSSNSMFIIFHLDNPEIEKFVSFKWKEFKAVQTPPLVQLIENNGKTTAASSSSLGKGLEIIHRRIDSEQTGAKTVAPDISIVNAKCPDTCAPNNVLDDRLCRSEFILRVKFVKRRTIKLNQGMLYYWIVEISKDFKLGKIAFRKTLKNNGKGLKATGIVETTMATKIFVECKSCPSIKKGHVYIIAGSELRQTKIRGNDILYNGILNANDIAVHLSRDNHKEINQRTEDIIYSCKNTVQ